MYEPLVIMPGSPEQEAVWRAFLRDKHIVVNADAGTGKTHTMVQACLRNEAEDGLRNSILYLAFNKHNAEEHTGKLRASGITLSTGSTCHSFGFRAVVRAFPGAAVKDYKTRNIIDAQRWASRITWADQGEVRRMVEQAASTVKNHNLDTEAPAYHARLTEIADYQGLDTPIAPQHWETIMDLAAAVIKEGDNVAVWGVDFDDMIYLPLRLSLALPRHDVVIVDEAQDLNPSQQELVMRAAGTGRVVVVGDSKQAIYGFRGADTNSMANMRDRLAATERGVVELGLHLTRRCNRACTALARRWGAREIECLPEAPEGVVRIVESLEAIPGDLVLARTNAALTREAYSLIRRGVKVEIKGRDLGEGLAKIVGRAAEEGITTREGTMGYLKGWEEGERMKLGRLQAAGRDIEKRAAALDEQYECLLNLVLGAPGDDPGPLEIAQGIREIFSDTNPDGTPKRGVVMGTVHRTKGLEAETVWIISPELFGKFGRKDWEKVQERNIGYIAVTRVKFSKESEGELNVVGKKEEVPSGFR